MAKGGNPKYMAKGGNPKYMSKGGADRDWETHIRF